MSGEIHLHSVRVSLEPTLDVESSLAIVRDAGACAILVGETFMRADDIGAKVRELMGN